MVVAPMTVRMAHRFADGIEEGPTGVLHQMPPICDLYRVWQGLGRGFAISATTVTGDDFDRGMSSQPGLGRRRLTIRQQGDDPAPFQVADDASVPVIAPPRPIVNANDLERVGWRAAAASHDAQERVFAHRQHQAFCEACRRSTTKRQAKVMNDRVQPRRAARRWCQGAFRKALGEDLTPAQNRITAKTASDHQELDDPA
jgi:hypothetical protein